MEGQAAVKKKHAFADAKKAPLKKPAASADAKKETDAKTETVKRKPSTQLSSALVVKRKPSSALLAPADEQKTNVALPAPEDGQKTDVAPEEGSKSVGNENSDFWIMRYPSKGHIGILTRDDSLISGRKQLMTIHAKGHGVDSVELKDMADILIQELTLGRSVEAAKDLAKNMQKELEERIME